MQPGRSGQRCCFIKYGTAAEADAAIQSLNGVFKFDASDAETVTVRFADKSRNNKRSAENAGMPSFAPSYAQPQQYAPPQQYAMPAADPMAAYAAQAGMPYAVADPMAAYGAQPQMMAGMPYMAGMAAPGMAAPAPAADPMAAYNQMMAAQQYNPYAAQPYAAQPYAAQPEQPKPRRQRVEGVTGGKLFVGSLPSAVTEVELKSLFAPHGALEPGDEVHVLPPKGTQGMGCAFVKFQDADAAAMAKQSLHDRVLGFPSFFGFADKLQVRLADNSARPGETAVAGPNTTKLFVGNLPPGVTPPELKMLCEIFGAVEAEDGVHVLPPKGTRGTLCAFVKFCEASHAATTIQALDQQPFPFPSFIAHGEPLLVRVADGDGKERTRPSRIPPAESKMNMMWQPDPQQMAAMPGMPVVLGQDMSAMQPMVMYGQPQMFQQQVQQPRAARGRDTSGTKLFVGNLNPAVTQADLIAVFSPYGALLAGDEVHVLPPKGTRGNGCAFVKYESPESAASALTALNNQPVPFPSAPHHTEPITVRMADAGRK